MFVISTVLIFTSTFTIATFSYMRTSDCCFSANLKSSLGIVPLLAVIAMFIGHALGVVPVCQLLAAEVNKFCPLKMFFIEKFIHLDKKHLKMHSKYYILFPKEYQNSTQ